VLESKWPSETSNALVKWRRIRHLVMAISQLKAALKNKSMSALMCAFSECVRQSW